MRTTRQKTEGQRPRLIALKRIYVVQNIEGTSTDGIVVRQVPGSAPRDEALLRGFVEITISETTHALHPGSRCKRQHQEHRHSHEKYSDCLVLRFQHNSH